MVVNMIVASRRVYACLVLALSCDMAAIIGHAACGCQTVLAWCLPCSGKPKGVKRSYAVPKLWVYQSRGSQVLY